MVRLCGKEVPHPGHVCAFFESPQHKYETFLPYLRDAIDAGDEFLNIVDGATRADHIAWLNAADVPVASAMASEQLQILTSEETYLQPGVSNLDHLLDMLRQKLETVEREHGCLRTFGEMTWLGRIDLPVKRVFEYEARVNQFFPNHSCTLVCSYDLASTPPSLMTEILATHPVAIIKGRLRPNPYFVSPEDYLRMLEKRPLGVVAPAQ
ncbi:MAG TPA: MEDS domain-containing protein [Longimicrobiales bacterium]